MTSAVELAEKRRRVHALLDARGLDAVVLRAPGNVAWYTGGGRSHILPSAGLGVADLVVTRDGERVVTHVNEAPRLAAEEFAHLDADLTTVHWAADRAESLPSGSGTGCDMPLPGRTLVADDVEAARRSLTADEQQRYADLGADTASAFTDVLSTLTPATSEHAAAGELARALIACGADPIVLLVAGGDRLAVHRHPLPTAGPLGPLAMLVACAMRGGLIANMTRFVSFDPLSAQLQDGYRRLLDVEAAYLDATAPGATVGSVFRAGAAAYAEQGFGAAEVGLHHQGGPTGYASRDYLAVPDSPAVVEAAQAFAWNPSVASLKVEDTVLAGAGGVQVLTVDPRWPTVEVGGRARPAVLELA